MIEVRQLRHFLAVIEHGGIRQAARAIPLSASAVARSIAMIESHYGVELLSRTKQQLLPTAFGRRLAEDAAILVAGFDGIGDRLAQLANLDAGTLRVGIGPAVSSVLMPAVATRMAKQHPRVRLEISYDHAIASMERMRSHELDVAVGAEDAFPRDGSCEVAPLYRETVEWWVRREHPLAGRRRPKVADLKDFPIIAQFMPTPFEEWFDELLPQGRVDRQGQGAALSLQCNDYTILMRVASGSDAVLLAPPHTMSESGHASQFVSIALPKYPEFVFAAALPLFPSPSPLAERFVHMLKQTSRDLLDTAIDD